MKSFLQLFESRAMSAMAEAPDDILSYMLMLKSRDFPMERHRQVMDKIGVPPAEGYDINSEESLVSKEIGAIPDNVPSDSGSPDTLRLFTSVLSNYAIWSDEGSPNAPEVARSIAQNGFQLDNQKGDYYKDSHGANFSCVWTKTQSAHNKGTLWATIDCPVEWLLEYGNSDLRDMSDVDYARAEDAQVRVGKSIPPDWIVNFNGIPAEYFRS